MPKKTEELGNFVFPSERSIWHGFAAFNTKFAGLIKEETEKSEELKSILDLNQNEDWKTFLDGDIKKQTELNETNLAGQQE